MNKVVSIGVQAIAFPALSTSGFAYYKICTFKCMAVLAVSFALIQISFASSEVYASRNGFQVIRIAATSCSAQMIKIKTFGNLSLKEFVSNSMNTNNFAFVARMPVSPKLVDMSQPQPATGIRLDVDFVSNVFWEEI
jgi:hypothetical protein